MKRTINSNDETKSKKQKVKIVHKKSTIYPQRKYVRYIETAIESFKKLLANYNYHYEIYKKHQKKSFVLFDMIHHARQQVRCQKDTIDSHIIDNWDNENQEDRVVLKDKLKDLLSKENRLKDAQFSNDTVIKRHWKQLLCITQQWNDLLFHYRYLENVGPTNDYEKELLDKYKYVMDSWKL